jgi:hypothetical protein
MRLQKETSRKPQATSRLNSVVCGVALLWLATSLLLLLLYRAGPANPVQPHKNADQQLALVVPQAAARASFM